MRDSLVTSCHIEFIQNMQIQSSYYFLKEPFVTKLPLDWKTDSKIQRALRFIFVCKGSKDYKTKLFKMFCQELEGVYPLKDPNKQPFFYW